MVAEATETLQATGTLDIEEWVRQYPEHEAELREVLPTMLLVHRVAVIDQLDKETRPYAIGLFSKLNTARPGA